MSGSFLQTNIMLLVAHLWHFPDEMSMQWLALKVCSVSWTSRWMWIWKCFRWLLYMWRQFGNQMCHWKVKGLVYPKMKLLSLITHPHVVPIMCAKKTKIKILFHIFVSNVTLVDVRSRQYMTQTCGGASADPDPAWWRWTHALCSTSSCGVFNTLDLDQRLRHHTLASCRVTHIHKSNSRDENVE